MTPDWTRVTEKAGWQARDSSGEVVFKEQMWILGGWFSSFEPCPRDVWSSPDGSNWTRVRQAAPWKHGDLPMTLVFDDRMWLMGGWFNGLLPGCSASSEVWSSTDGLDWKQVTARAGWSPRLAAGAIAFQDKMWILGGIENYFLGDDASLRNDVWCSTDGETWDLVTKQAGWSPRAFHQAVVLDGKMWVLGGGNYVPNHFAVNDVWCSEDGVEWTQVAEDPPWRPRLWFSSVAYRDRIWVLGGWSQEEGNMGDVWYSADGEGWTPLKSEVLWRPRHEHSAFVFQDRIWVAGGHAAPLSSEVWSLHLPVGWVDAEGSVISHGS